MRFPTTWQRRHGGSGPIKQFSDDTVPTTSPPAGQDNTGSYRFWNTNGFPVQRVAVAFTASTSVTAPTAVLYAWEETLGYWLACSAAVTLVQNGIAYFDVPTVSEQAPTKATINGNSSGCLDVMLIVTASSDATYTFAMAPDVTTVGS